MSAVLDLTPQSDATLLREAVTLIRDEWKGDRRSLWGPAARHLAVADWLYSVVEAIEPEPIGRTIAKVDEAHAFVVARAYLGGQP